MSHSATIQMIDEIFKLENSDFLEVASILGWKCVVKKGEFKIGDKCVYIEIDSEVPRDNPHFSFLEKYKYHVRTIKLRGQISQGLALPINILKNDHEVGDDVSEELGVIHYEKPIPLKVMGMAKGNFPSYLCSKTDEIMIQSYPKMIEELHDQEYYMTVKCNGSSVSFISHPIIINPLLLKDTNINFDFHVCSRNISLKYWEEKNKDNVFIRMAKKYNILEKLSNIRNIAIQGEVCGPGIQGNDLQLKDHKVFVFNVYNTEGQYYYNYDDMIHICKDLDLEPVPLIERGIWNKNKMTIPYLLEKSAGLYDGTKNPREGIVIRPTKEMTSKIYGGRRLSFKVLNNEHLLGKNE